MARVQVSRKVNLQQVMELFSIYKKQWERKYHEVCICQVTPKIRQKLKAIAMAIDENEFKRRVNNFLDVDEYAASKRHPILLFIANIDQHGGKKNGTYKKRSRQETGICKHGTFNVEEEIKKNKRARRTRN